MLYIYLKLAGRGILAYRDDIRMSRACDLLANSDLNITAVAHEVGYPDSQYFSRQFKKRFSQSPRNYRNDSKDNE